jgi:hypothetical protein
MALTPRRRRSHAEADARSLDDVSPVPAVWRSMPLHDRSRNAVMRYGAHRRCKGGRACLRDGCFCGTELSFVELREELDLPPTRMIDVAGSPRPQPARPTAGYCASKAKIGFAGFFPSALAPDVPQGCRAPGNHNRCAAQPCGRMTTLMTPSSLSRKRAYISGASSRLAGCVMTKLGSISPATIFSSSGLV